MNPGQALFADHVSRPDFIFGREQGMWAIEPLPAALAWPRAMIWLPASEHLGAAGRVHLLFDLAGYNEEAPTSFPCDPSSGNVLPDAQWPKGNPVVDGIFRPNWNRGALYLPCDRQALPNHPDWPQKFPTQLWAANRMITHYLTIVHTALNPFTG